MSVCGICTKNVNSKMPGLQCGGRCLNFFHSKCVNLNKQDLIRFKDPGSYWCCPSCRTTSGINTSVVMGDEDNIESVGDINTILNIMQSIQADIKSLHNKYDLVLDSVKFCSEKITTFEATLSKLNEKVNKIEKISNENSALKHEVNNLQTRVEQLEQYTRINNLEIQGVPEKPNENIYHILEKIGDGINCPITPNDVDIAHRVAHMSPKPQPKAIIVRFLSRKKRDEVLGAAKLKYKLTSNNGSIGLKIEDISNKLFINEHLTSQNKLLLKNAKDVAREKHFKYVWVRYGHVFMRRDDRSPVLKLNVLSDLNKIN